MVGNIGLGDKANRSRDILGRVYEYFLSQFASAEGKKGGQFYTPRCVVRVLVEMLAPYKGRVYDPCCGSGGMFVQSVEFVKAHAAGNGNGGKTKADVSIFGQESNHTTWRLAKMNLAIRHHNHILTPGRYVGAAEVEDDGEPFEEKMARLTTALREQTGKAEKLDRIIWANLEDVGYGG